MTSHKEAIEVLARAGSKLAVSAVASLSRERIVNVHLWA
jgi:hypothetical protein